jgi:phosphinothricin acetyltransferase
MAVGGGIDIRDMRPEDWPAVRAIYAEGIATGLATFETEVPEWTAWDAAHRAEARLVAVSDGVVVGFFAVAPYSSRAVYRGVAWESVYSRRPAAAGGSGSGSSTPASRPRRGPGAGRSWPA